MLNERPLVAEPAPLMPRPPQSEDSGETVEGAYPPWAAARLTRWSDDTAHLWRVRLLALSALLVALVILVSLLLTH